jgi:acetyl-CoA C-acetyltransferase
MTTDAFICDAIRTPFGRYGGALSSVRADDLGAVPLKALVARNKEVDWAALTDVIFGCANQAGEDNRNVARMSSLLAGLPIEVPGSTINRLCGSGMDAVGTAARAIKSGEAQLMIAGGVESMSRAPFVMPKAETAFSRSNAVYDTTIGWRFVNRLMKEQYGVDSMPETAENVAIDFGIERVAQDRMALASQLKAVAAQRAGFFEAELTPVTVPQKKGEALVISKDDGGAGEAERRRASRRHGDCRQRIGRQRRRLRAAARERGCRSEERSCAEGARGRHGHRRRRAAHHGIRAGAGRAEGARANRAAARPD